MKEKDSLKTNVIYIVLGIALAFIINLSLGLVLFTDMPIVAVESNSMVPTFSKGDILILQGDSTGEFSVGDIIVFSVNEQSTPIVHRVIEKSSDNTYTTKGDANSMSLSFEKDISSSQIHGKAVMIVPYVGWLKIGITEFVLPNMFFVVIIVVFASVLYFKRDKIYKR